MPVVQSNYPKHTRCYLWTLKVGFLRQQLHMIWQLMKKIFMGTSSLNNKGRIYTFLDHTAICKLKYKYWNTAGWLINTETPAFILASLVTSGPIPSLHMDSLDPKYHNHNFNEICLVLNSMILYLFQIFFGLVCCCGWLFIYFCLFLIRGEIYVTNLTCVLKLKASFFFHGILKICVIMLKIRNFVTEGDRKRSSIAFKERNYPQ